MKVFISWSGNKSHKVALVFREWLPSVIQSLEPYVSSEDIDKGARWSSDIAKELEDSTFGILCVTKENLHAPWLSFEAGALSKTMDKSFVTPFLFDIKRSEVNGPILQFQSTVFEKDDIKKLIHTLNKACGENGITESMLDKAFEVWYPTLEKELNNLKDCDDNTAEKIVKEEIYSPEIIEEILELSRDNQKLLRNPDTKIIESIDGLKERIDITLSKFERSVDVEERRMTRKYRTILMEELVHSILPECQKQYTFLIVLSMIQDKFPWVYNMGKELLDILASENGIDVKRESIRNFQKIMEFSFEHPVMREIYMRRKDEYIMMRDVEHMLIELINALEYDIIS
ncbi:MAG: TIR domain-containing protein [Lachnospiraceae bacterium]|nr:TIR domain-containing protein [Lachnospiraceae bacterium]